LKSYLNLRHGIRQALLDEGILATLWMCFN